MMQYSENNQQLIREAMPTATECRTYRQWQAMGRQVRKGEKAIKIYAPKGKYAVEKDQKEGKVEAKDEEEVRTRFRAISVFDVSQTDLVLTEEDAVEA